jgi:hypothetical protein
MVPVVACCRHRLVVWNFDGVEDTPGCAGCPEPHTDRGPIRERLPVVSLQDALRTRKASKYPRPTATYEDGNGLISTYSSA